ncbi:MAG: MFS transporter [Burkholderiaceae bacterium]|nr:MFS transporter [Burkholderiaceae bacterium]
MVTDTAATAGPPPDQFALLRQRRFAPYFWTQFTGAANDNLFKFAFTILVTYQLQVAWLPPSLAGLVIGALFILPFVLFSATSGQLADKMEKSRLMRLVKNLEVGIMVLAAFGFLTGNVPVLLACTFGMGLHSTLFGPVKFAYLPQVLGEREITGGNGMVEMGTFVAILLGNVAGGLIVAIPETGHRDIAIACVLAALAGRAVVQWVPKTAATDPQLQINWNPFTETWRNLKIAHEDLVVFRSLLGISWMWFFGAVFLSQFPAFAKDVLHGDAQVASLLLVLFSVGVGVGALLCERLSRRHVEIGLVPIGALGMSVFSIDLYFASRGLPPAASLTLAEFVVQPAHWRLMADLVLLALFAGIYSVPMYALIQLRSPVTHRARIIAANNILNALFMIASSLLAGVLISAGFTVPQVFLFTGLANIVVGAWVFLVVPDYLIRCVAWVLSRLFFRLRLRGEQHLPATGPAVLVCNHIGAVDPFLVIAATPRPVRLLVNQGLLQRPVAGWLFRLSGAIAPNPEGPHPFTAGPAAQEAALQALNSGEMLVVFPEGRVSNDGSMQIFNGGLLQLLKLAHSRGLTVPVILMTLTSGAAAGAGGSVEPAERRRLPGKPAPRSLFAEVTLSARAPVAGPTVTMESLRDQVAWSPDKPVSASRPA